MNLLAAILITTAQMSTLPADNNFHAIYTAQITLSAGQSVLIQGTLVTQSAAASTAIMELIRPTVYLNGNMLAFPAGSPVPNIGNNNIGYSANFAPNGLLTYSRLFTAPKDGTYTINLESLASTSAKGSYSLYIVEGILQITPFTGIESFALNRWTAGYDTVIGTPVRMLGAKYTAQNGPVSVYANLELTTPEPASWNTNAMVGIILINKTQGTAVCLPSGLQPIIINGDRDCLTGGLAVPIINTGGFYQHHATVSLSGSIAANPGDLINAKVEIASDTPVQVLTGSSLPGAQLTTPASNLILGEQP